MSKSVLRDKDRKVLTLIVEGYVRGGRPVSSGAVAQTGRFSGSPATIRNIMAKLEAQGYLSQPHTSAGRVPTEEGYRFFVGRLVQETELPATMRHTISHQFYQTRQDVDQWMRLAASVLARQSKAASLVTAPHPEQARFKHLELINTRGRQVLMVIVLVGGEIHQHVFTLVEPVTQEQLSITANRLAILFQGMDMDTMAALKSQLNALEGDILNIMLAELSRAETTATGEVYLDGLTNVLAEPEFSGSEDARRALRLLEERSMLEDLLSRTVLTTSVGGVQVLIGGEGTFDDLRQCAVVLARYGTPGLATGTLGVLGTMRMPYGRTISTVRFVANLLSDMVAETLGG